MIYYWKIAVLSTFFMTIKSDIFESGTSIKYNYRHSSGLSENAPPAVHFSLGHTVRSPYADVPLEHHLNISFHFNASTNVWEKSTLPIDTYGRYPLVVKEEDPKKGKSIQTNVTSKRNVATKNNVATKTNVAAKTNVATKTNVTAKTNVAANTHVATKTNVASKNPVDEYKEDGYDPELDCGTSFIDIRLASTVATSVNRSQLQNHPWNAAVYYQFNVGSNQMVLYCGGTIISLYSVLTAAHCINTLDRKGELMWGSEKRYKVAVGKFFTDFNESEEQAQVIDVEHIHLPELHSLPFTTDFSDLAILELKNPISYGEFSIPACIDTENKHELIDNKTEGEVVAWGSDENGTIPESLQKAPLLYFNRNTCFIKMPDADGLSLSKDKFCSLVEKGSPTVFQSGDSGAGIIFKFPKTAPQDVRPYIYGVVSTLIINTTVVTITDLRKKTHLDFIKNTLKIIARNHKKNIWS